MLRLDFNYKYKLATGNDEVESCQPNPCQNDGKCVSSGNLNRCQCVGHFTGRLVSPSYQIWHSRIMYPLDSIQWWIKRIYLLLVLKYAASSLCSFFRFCGLTVCEMEPCIFGKCELTPNAFKVRACKSADFALADFLANGPTNSSWNFVWKFDFEFHFCFSLVFILCSVIACKATLVECAIKSKNHVPTIRARVAANALRKMVNFIVDVMRGGKGHDANDEWCAFHINHYRNVCYKSHFGLVWLPYSLYWHSSVWCGALNAIFQRKLKNCSPKKPIEIDVSCAFAILKWFMIVFEKQNKTINKNLFSLLAHGSLHHLHNHHNPSLREQLQFTITNSAPQSTATTPGTARTTIFGRLGIRKPSILSLSSQYAPNGGATARTFSLDDLLRPPPRRKTDRKYYLHLAKNKEKKTITNLTIKSQTRKMR